MNEVTCIPCRDSPVSREATAAARQHFANHSVEQLLLPLVDTGEATAAAPMSGLPFACCPPCPPERHHGGPTSHSQHITPTASALITGPSTTHPCTIITMAEMVGIATRPAMDSASMELRPLAQQRPEGSAAGRGAMPVDADACLRR